MCVQVVFFMYLWSIDMEAVTTAMSCFRLMCEEAEIRCGADELAVTQILPNYTVYMELAAASTVLATGACVPPLMQRATDGFVLRRTCKSSNKLSIYRWSC